MNPWDQFTGANAGYVQELYERYQRDPGSVDEATRQAFAAWAPPAEPAVSHGERGPPARRACRAGGFQLAESIRRFGHLAARLDPLGFHEPVGDPSLDPQRTASAPTPFASCPPISWAGRRPRERPMPTR